MTEAAKPLWGSRYRGDLRIVKALGANHVRMYGNNPDNVHSSFLDEAHATGLNVIIGISDWPYTQSPDSCKFHSNYTCFSQVRKFYLDNLRKGLLTKSRHYHPALAHIIVMSEPDLKMPGPASNRWDPVSFCRTIISAVDGMLDAEREAHVQGNLINFTATFSFGICGDCRSFNENPSLGQMDALRMAFLNPLAYGYRPRNNLAEFYYYRFINSFNTANPAADIRPLFLTAYEEYFPAVPVVIQEYHSPGEHINQTQDLHAIMEIVQGSSLLQGVSFFEYQVRYDKGDGEMQFGIFQLGDYSFAEFDYFGNSVDSFCLKPMVDITTSQYLASTITSVFDGDGIDLRALCIPDPRKVPVTQEGFEQMVAQQSLGNMAVFIARTVRHMGGEVWDESGLNSFAQAYGFPPVTYNFTELVGALSLQPAWAVWDPDIACSVDRDALASQVGHAFDWACGQTAGLNCSAIPEDCSSNIWDLADYAFSMYFNEHKGAPLTNCYFDGAALPVSSLMRGVAKSNCIVSPNPFITALTEDGYSAVLSKNSSDDIAVFIRRIVVDLLAGGISDQVVLLRTAEVPPTPLSHLLEFLKVQDWVCGPQSSKPCPTETTTSTSTRTHTTSSTTSATKTVTQTSLTVTLSQTLTISTHHPRAALSLPEVVVDSPGKSTEHHPGGQYMFVAAGVAVVVGVMFAVLACTKGRTRQAKADAGGTTIQQPACRLDRTESEMAPLPSHRSPMGLPTWV